MLTTSLKKRTVTIAYQISEKKKKHYLSCTSPSSLSITWYISVTCLALFLYLFCSWCNNAIMKKLGPKHFHKFFWILDCSTLVYLRIIRNNSDHNNNTWGTSALIYDHFKKQSWKTIIWYLISRKLWNSISSLMKTPKI